MFQNKFVPKLPSASHELGLMLEKTNSFIFFDYCRLAALRFQSFLGHFRHVAEST